MNLATLGEFGLIKSLRCRLRVDRHVLLGIGDDAAVLEYNRQEYLLFTTDMLVEGVHFKVGTPGCLIGHKAMVCNVSDIAAMGGIPTHAVVSLGVAPRTKLKFVQDIYSGMNQVARRFAVSIVGGDTVKSKKLVLNVALLGRVKKSQLVTRAGAKVGDVIFVTGKLGRSFVTRKHLSFTPRLPESQFLARRFKPTAMIDISDGLAADLGHILEESHVGAVLWEKAIPRTDRATLKNALYDGEDFELVFTLSPRVARRMKRLKSRFKFYEIGRIVEKNKGLSLVCGDGLARRLEPGGFRHF